MSYICPKCGSEHITTHKNIYEGGTSNIKTSSFGSGAGFGTGGVGAVFGSSTTRGKSQSVAAKKYEPPHNPALALIGLSILFAGITYVFLALGGILTFIAPLFILIIFKIFQKIKRNAKEYPDKLSTWENTWHCNKCGNDFTLN
jgi:predicted RNA-binding Zn-ribbon protein involved in translation (DUF1610 family)